MCASNNYKYPSAEWSRNWTRPQLRNQGIIRLTLDDGGHEERMEQERIQQEDLQREIKLFLCELEALLLPMYLEGFVA